MLLLFSDRLTDMFSDLKNGVISFMGEKPWALENFDTDPDNFFYLAFPFLSETTQCVLF